MARSTPSQRRLRTMSGCLRYLANRLGSLRGSLLGTLMGSLFMIGPLLTEAHAESGAAAPSEAILCASPQLDTTLREHVRAHRLMDAHGLAQFLLALCPSSPRRPGWKILDALVMDDLDDPLRAQSGLWEVATRASSPERETAATLLARSHLLARDDQAFALTLGRLPAATATRLRLFAAISDEDRFRKLVEGVSDPELASAANSRFAAYNGSVHTRRPWLAGSLSAILPGAGQVYAGSWQGAAVAFVLNAVLIGATVELGTRHLYVTAGATGMAASIFYVGNILNAVDLAQRRNEQAAQPAREALERLLVPEAYP